MPTEEGTVREIESNDDESPLAVKESCVRAGSHVASVKASSVSTVKLTIALDELVNPGRRRRITSPGTMLKRHSKSKVITAGKLESELGAAADENVSSVL
jgi:hypothetical protein